MLWNPGRTEPRDGRWFLAIVECGDGTEEPVVVRYNGRTRGGGDFGPFCWSQPMDGEDIAERALSRWIDIPAVV